MSLDLPDSGKKSRRLLSEINVTPLVDVMLVLLIIFMITAPMMIQGLDVDLPETTENPVRQSADPLLITVDKDGEIYFDDIKGSRSLLRQELSALAERRGTDKAVLLRADQNVPYGLVAAIMDDIREAGFNQLGMITKPSTQ